MKLHQNTLFVTTQGAYLAKDGEAVLVRVDGETRMRVPIHTIGGIACFGVVSCSPPLMQLCCERGVAISFMSEQGRFLGRVEGPMSGNVLLRREQYRRADSDDGCSAVVCPILIAKIANCRTVMLRALRDRPEAVGAESLMKTSSLLKQRVADLKPNTPVEVLRGVEGDCARHYFETFDHLIAAQKDDFVFRGRNRRPPLDNMNALLSFLYALLEHDTRSALQAVGLDSAVGFLHKDRPGRPGLSLDLMEEFRPFLADRLALSLVNLRQVAGEGFRKSESGGIEMDDETRKTVLVAYQKRKQEDIVHPFLDERTTVGMLVHLQARLLARFIRGDLDGYPAFVWR